MGVINTVSNIMGNSAFLGGITTYLNTYEFSVATSEELGTVLDGVFPGISAVMNSYILQEGFPLIIMNATVDSANDNNLLFAVEQRRFVKQGQRFYMNSSDGGHVCCTVMGCANVVA